MSITIYQILDNLNASIPALNSLVTGGSVLLGAVFMVRGIYKLKHFAEMRTMMSSQNSLMEPVVLLMVGAILLYWPSMLSASLETIFSTTSPLAYQASGYGENYDVVIQTCGNMIKLIGFIAFIRGWLLIAKYNHQGAQGGSNLTKGIWHVVGGTCAINIYETWQIVKSTLGV